MTSAAAHVLDSWSPVLGSPAVSELAPGRVWELTTERGDRFVLKKVSTFGVPDPLRRFTDEARILTYLGQRDVPVAVPVLARDGLVYATDDDGAPWAVFPMLPQDDADHSDGLDPVLFRNMGAAIARLHVALAGCPFGVESWTVGPGSLAASRQTARDRLPAGTYSELSARVRPHWEAMARALSAAPQRVHGDVHGGNILTVGQQVTGIVDCDHLPLAPRGYDLGYYLAFAAHWWLDGDQPTRSIDEFRHLLAGYQAVSPLTQPEIDDLPALALVATLGLISYFLSEQDLAEESWLRTAHWIDGHFDALRFPVSS